MPDQHDSDGPMGSTTKGFTVTDRRRREDGAGDDGGPAAQAPAARPDSVGPDPKALPQLDFTTFLMSLASSVLMHLGELVAPDEPGARPNLPLAKQTIDLLGLLEDKTRGNLTDEEARLLQHLLYDLRLKFVDARKRVP